jgi:hypothetical protein
MTEMRFLNENLGSFPFRLNAEELKAIGRGALVAVLGALIPSLVALAGGLDDATVLGGWLAAAAAVGVNSLRKWVFDNSETPQ